MEEENDDKDDTKRKSRNLGEKKRRDQFNMLINELGSMVNRSSTLEKMDKSTVLKSTIMFLKNYNETAARSKAHGIGEIWKPSFLSNEEFIHLILEALDGFIIVFSSDGRIFYISENVTPLLGYLPDELINLSIHEIIYDQDRSYFYNELLNIPDNISKKQISFTCRMRRGTFDPAEEPVYELIRFTGNIRSDVDLSNDPMISSDRLGNTANYPNAESLFFVGTGRLQIPNFIKEITVVDSGISEFTSQHSLEWKFLFLDHRAPPIIGYLPFEILGTSGYDYYHINDLDDVVSSHMSLMQKGEGNSCHYRFLTKGQQWIWLQTRFYISYDRWNSKPRFIVCTHRVLSYAEVIKARRKNVKVHPEIKRSDTMTAMILHDPIPSHSNEQDWFSKSSKVTESLTRHSGVRSLGELETASLSDDLCLEASESLGLREEIEEEQKIKIESASSSTFFGSSHYQKNVSVQNDYNSNHPSSNIPLISFIPPSSEVSSNGALMEQSWNEATSESNSNVCQQLSPQALLTTPTESQLHELQYKYQELQQLIVHHQEELKKISEQLLFAKYGILHPISNAEVSYNQQSTNQPSIINIDGDNTSLEASATVNFAESIPAELLTQPVSMNTDPGGVFMTSENSITSTILIPSNYQIQQTHQQSSDQGQQISSSNDNLQLLIPELHQEDIQNLMTNQISQAEGLIYTDISSSVASQQDRSK